MSNGELEGRIAVVTGGGGGFGEGIARSLARDGAKVVVGDIDASAARRVAADIDGVAQKVDVADGMSVSAFAEAVLTQLGRIDILVNNAGVAHRTSPMHEIDEAEFDRVTTINSKSIYLTARSFVPHLRAQRSGNIVNISSTMASSPRANMAWYSASKGWIVAATRAMAIELAPFGIRVNAIKPVAGETRLLEDIIVGNEEVLRDVYLRSIPLGRFARPEDIGNAASFLCSNRASMITGIAMEVDGGRCI